MNVIRNVHNEVDSSLMVNLSLACEVDMNSQTDCSVEIDYSKMLFLKNQLTTTNI